MASVAPYIPAKQAAFDAWLSNFATLIDAFPGRYGLTPADATTISGIQAAWATAYAAVTSPTTKTASAVAAKNTARVSATAQVRVYSQQISNNPGVSSENKIALGLNPKTSLPSPVTAPASNPTLVVQSAGNLSLILRYRDSVASPSVKSKPYGVIACQVFYAVSATAITVQAANGQVAMATKSPLTLTFQSADAGKQCYLWARWITRTGLFSPWSPIVNFTVPAAM